MKTNIGEMPQINADKGTPVRKDLATEHVRLNRGSKELLRLSKQHGESYSETISRIVKQNSAIKRDPGVSENAPAMGSGGVLNAAQVQIPELLALYGLKPSDVAGIVKNLLKPEKIPRSYRPFNATKAFGYACWVSVAVFTLYFVLPFLGGVV